MPRLVKMSTTVDFDDIKQIAGRYPAYRAWYLYRMGKVAKEELYSSFVSGQELTYYGRQFTKRNGLRHKANYKMRNRNSTRLALVSSPMNLYERGFTQTNGRVERAREVLTKKLPAVMRRRANGVVAWIEGRMQRDFDTISSK